MLFFFPAVFGNKVLLLEACKRLVSIEDVVLNAFDIEGIWEGAAVDSFLCLLHPLPFLPPWLKLSPLGWSLHLSLFLVKFVCWLILGLSVLSVLITSEEL